MTDHPDSSNKDMPELITKLLKAAHKEVFRQFESMLDAVEPSIIEQADEADSSLDSDRLLLLADEFNRGRPILTAEFSKILTLANNDFNQSELDYKAQLKSSGLSLICDDTLQEKIEIQKLIAKSLGELNYVLVPVLSGFNQALPEAVINTSTMPFFPQTIGNSIQVGIIAAELSDPVDNLLREKVRDVFLPSMKHLYLGIQKQLEAHGYKLEQPKTYTVKDNRNSRASMADGNRLIAVPEDFDINLLELLSKKNLPAALFGDGFSNSTQLSNVPSDIGEDKAIVTVSNKDVDNMLAALQVADEKPQNSGEDIRQSLADNLQSRSSDSQYNVMSAMGENIINLVALMFEFIDNDSTIPTFISALLMRLQIPYMRMALANTELFEDSKHPARQLLNDLTELGYIAKSTESNAYIMLNSYVTKVTESLDNSNDQITELQKSVSEFLLQIADTAAEHENSIEQQAQLDAKQEEALEGANAAVKEFVVDPIKRLKKPMHFHALLEKVWAKVLHASYMNNLPLSEERSEAIDLFEQILWSTGAGKTTLLKPALIKALPSIVKRIGRIFSSYTIDELIKSHFMEQLQEIHIAFIKNADNKKIMPIDEDVLVNTAKTKDIVDELEKDQLAEDQQLQLQASQLQAIKKQQAVGHDYVKPQNTVAETEDLALPEDIVVTTAAEAEPVIELETVSETEENDDIVFEFSFSTPTTAVSHSDTTENTRLAMTDTLNLVDSICTGTHMNYMIKGEFKRCKIAFYAPSLGKYIFTDHQGLKLFDRFRAELIVDIQDGYAKVLNNDNTFDRALESVVSAIRNQRG
ncbi:MAG: hypothetical protein ACJAYG_001257 [Oceanicoccus sp.]|jgi:hypothetical protein